MWLILIALAIGLIYASLLYLFSKKYGKGLTILLFALRTATVTTIVMLFINPYIKQKINKIEQPIIVFAQDNSTSVIMTKDSVFYKEKYPQLIDSVVNTLEKDFDIDFYLFSSEIALKDEAQQSFTGHYTNISKALSDIQRLYYKKNAGAVVLLSDGIVNQGVKPELNIENFPFPIYSVTLGDTILHPTTTIQEVKYNKTVPADMLFPLRVTVNAQNCRGENMEVTVKMDGVEVEDTVVAITNNRFSKTLNFNINSGDEGTKQIDIQANNSHRRIFIEVTDRKYNILCYAKAPHPDIAAIKSALDDHFEFKTVYSLPEDLSNCDLIILHQTTIKENEGTNGIPTLTIIGKDIDFEAFNASQNAMTLHRGAASGNFDVRARYNNNFGLFTLNSEIKNEIQTYPPLSLPHLEMTFNAHHDELMFMNIMDLDTQNPLIAFTDDADGNKMGFIFGTGCWRWKLYEFYQHKNHVGFNELFSKTIKYLLTEKDKELIINYKESYITTENINLSAELRNPSRELFNEPDLHLTIVNKNTKSTYEYEFSKGNNNYFINIGMLPEGVYSLHAHASFGGLNYDAHGTFSVASVGVESLDLRADVERMRYIASQTGGKHYYITDIQQLIKDLENDERITSISREETRYDDLINFKLLFFIVLGLLTTEWVIRKIFGIY